MTTACTYASTNYYARAYWGMGEPLFRRAENRWTVLIHHVDGLTTGYVEDNERMSESLSREDYMAGIERQRKQEEE